MIIDNTMVEIDYTRPEANKYTQEAAAATTTTWHKAVVNHTRKSHEGKGDFKPYQVLNETNVIQLRVQHPQLPRYQVPPQQQEQ
jgi:hypothetical protein